MSTSGLALPESVESPQYLRRSEELKNIVANKKDLYGDTEAWASHQELAGLYRRLLLTDLEYALDKKVEQDLWNYCFKTYISHLQTVMRDKRSSNRGEAQMTLTWFLENASGFYILLLEELRQVFSLDIPFLQTSSPYGISGGADKIRQGPMPQKSSCHYICQHCLVHLGDIARYRSQTRQAETFYRHAICLAPSSGHPYNQIAILEASRGNKLATVYFYVRAVALRNPFPAASTNLAKMLAKLAGLVEQEGDEQQMRERTGKVTAHTFIPMLLRVHGLLHHACRLKAAVKMSKLLTESLTALVTTESFSTWQLIQIIAVNMWAWQQARSGQELGTMSHEERLVSAVVADIQAAILSAALLPVYTLQQGKQLLDYFALPAVKLLLEWIVTQPSVLKEVGMTSRPQIWPSLARILNEIQPLLAEFKPAQLHDYPLPEDYDLQAFQPLAPSLTRYNYRQVSQLPLTDQERLRLLRCCRLTEVGRALARLDTPTLRYSSEMAEFVAVELDIEPGKEVETLLEQVVDSEGDSSGSETAPEFEEDRPVEGLGKSILKTQCHSPVVGGGKEKKVGRQNVAMAAILRRAGLEGAVAREPGGVGEEEKTVTFKTPSPAPSQTSTQDSGSQYSNSQEDGGVAAAAAATAAAAGAVKKGRRGWSPPLVLKPKATLDDLDFSKPPPSLHSNYRPPALASPTLDRESDPQKQVAGISSLGRGRPAAYAGEGNQQPQQRDWWQGKDVSPESRILHGFPRLPTPELAPQNLRQGLPGLTNPALYPGPRQQAPHNQHMIGNPHLQHNSAQHNPLHNPNPHHPQTNPFQPLANPLNQPPPHPLPSTSNPLLQLLSSSTMANPSPGPHSQDTSGLLGLGGLGQLFPPPQSDSPRPNPPQHTSPQHYSLFSPSAWPGPLLTGSPGMSHTNTSPQHTNPTTTPTNMQLFGPGPSPLERLLHQTKYNK